MMAYGLSRAAGMRKTGAFVIICDLIALSAMINLSRPAWGPSAIDQRNSVR
jgi:hypothetical protein